MKKIAALFAFIAVLLSAVPAMTSCASEADRREAADSAASLIEASLEINEIFYGKGLPQSDADSDDSRRFADENGLDVNAVSYLPVSAECTYKSIQDIKVAAEKVYSSAYCAQLFKVGFEGFSNDEGTRAVYARYMEDESGTLVVRSDLSDTGIQLDRTFDTDTIKVKKLKSNTAVISVDSFLNGEKSDTLELTMVRQDGQWRLDTPTY